MNPILAEGTVLCREALDFRSKGIALVLGAMALVVIAAHGAETPNDAARTNQGEVVITFDGFTDIPGGQIVNFTMRNERSSSIWFSGYGPQSPRYLIECLTDKGWEEQGMLWCGTGLGVQELPPHAEFKFQWGRCDIMLKEVTRIGIRWSLDRHSISKGGGDQKTWSGMIPPAISTK